MEGADPITEPEEVGGWWKHGLRIVSLHGALDGRPFALGSPQCFVVAEKPLGT